jgi:NMD protein affecting ribosome stability and mRNA decay
MASCLACLSWYSLIQVVPLLDGIDFFYSSRGDAKRMVEFFMAVAPVRYKTSEQLIGADLQNNIYNYKVCS